MKTVKPINTSARALLAEAMAYVRREATSPTILLLEARRARDAAALVRLIDAQITPRKYRTIKENP